jgi:hypothetical protein
VIYILKLASLYSVTDTKWARIGTAQEISRARKRDMPVMPVNFKGTRKARKYSYNRAVPAREVMGMIEGAEADAEALRQMFNVQNPGEYLGDIVKITPDFERWIKEETMEWNGDESETMGVKGLGGGVRTVKIIKTAVGLGDRLAKRRHV